MNIKVLGTTALVAIMTAGTASAASVTSTFNFSGNGGILGSSSNFVADTGLTLNASAHRVNNNGAIINTGPAVLGQYTGGLGVCISGTNNAPSNSGGCNRGDNHQVDSDGTDESVQFNFGMQEVTVESVTLAFVNQNDDFSFSFFENSATNPADFTRDVAVATGQGRFGLSTFLFSNLANGEGTTGSLFGIGAGGSGDLFKITSLVVSHELSVSEVPLPAAAFLFGPALLGFMGLRRKAKNTPS